MKTQLFIVLVIVNVCWVLAEKVTEQKNEAHTMDIDVNGVKSTVAVPSTASSPPVLPPGPNVTTASPNISTTPTPTTSKPITSSIAPNTTVNPNTTTPIPITTTPITSTTLKPTNATTIKPPPSPTPVPTPSPPPSSSTTASPATTPAPNNRKFDGPSFVGGIVLASGLMAIGFVAFKFYKARTELNYHTL